MIKYNVTGMTCAACATRVERAVSAVDGVESCSVSLLTNSMGVEGTARKKDIIKAVETAGYGASLQSDMMADGGGIEDTQTPRLVRRLILSVVFLAPLMYVSMGHMMWSFPLPSFMSGNHLMLGIVQLVLTIIVMIINRKFFTSGFRGLLNKAPNMDTLVALGSLSAFVYSTYALIALAFAVHNNSSDAMHYMDNFYFESSATILTLITVGKTLESYSKGKTTNALNSLMRLAPKTAIALVDGVEHEIEVSDIKIGDIIVVRPGDSIAVDGEIIEGSTSVDESILTGESIPVDKQVGDFVSSGTINQSGYFKFRATRIGEDTTLSRIINMVSDVASTKAPISKTADRVSGVFVPVVIAIALVTLVVWLLCGREFGYALSRGISVLVISCPCTLGLATPVAIMVGNGRAAKNGILFKTAASLEHTGRVQIVALDKTGTITEGNPVVTDVLPADGVTSAELTENAYSLEAMSEHPLARAIVGYAEQNNCTSLEVADFRALVGNGVEGYIGGSHIIAGSLKYIRDIVSLSDESVRTANSLSEQGKTPLLFCRDNSLLGIIAVADVIKTDSPIAIEMLQNMGIRVVMLTGDNARTAAAIGGAAGVDNVYSELMPDDKERIVRELQQCGRVAMVGDGINDAPALTRADIGIAINAGADVAVDSADVVLMNNSLMDAAAAIRLSRATLRNIYENLFWAFIYNIIGIPLAAGVFVGITGWTLNPMFAAGAMSLSSFCVVMNALRLNLFNPLSSKKDKKIKQIDIQVKEKKIMTKVFSVEGMMCHNCEAHVVKALEAIDGVDKAVASFESKTVSVELSREVADDVIRAAIEDEGYKVL